MFLFLQNETPYSITFVIISKLVMSSKTSEKEIWDNMPTVIVVITDQWKGEKFKKESENWLGSVRVKQLCLNAWESITATPILTKPNDDVMSSSHSGAPGYLIDGDLALTLHLINQIHTNRQHNQQAVCTYLMDDRENRVFLHLYKL